MIKLYTYTNTVLVIWEIDQTPQKRLGVEIRFARKTFANVLILYAVVYYIIRGLDS